MLHWESEGMHTVKMMDLAEAEVEAAWPAE